MREGRDPSICPRCASATCPALRMTVGVECSARAATATTRLFVSVVWTFSRPTLPQRTRIGWGTPGVAGKAKSKAKDEGFARKYAAWTNAEIFRRQAFALRGSAFPQDDKAFRGSDSPFGYAQGRLGRLSLRGWIH
jgi:hypothetical protein